MNLIVSVFAAMAAAAAAGIASAEQTQPQSFPFEGGTLTITETDEFDKMLTFNGKELARDYVLYHNKTVEVAGQQVALFDAGDGGNQCGTGDRHRLEAGEWRRPERHCRRRLRLAAPGHHRAEHLFRALPAARRIEGRANMDADRRAAGRRHAVLHAATRHRLERSRSGQARQYRRRLRQRGGLRGRQEAARRRHHRFRNRAAGRRRHGVDAVRRILCQRLRAACLRRRRCLHGGRPARPQTLFRAAERASGARRPGRPSRTGRPMSGKPRKRRSADNVRRGIDTQCAS